MVARENFEPAGVDIAAPEKAGLEFIAAAPEPALVVTAVIGKQLAQRLGGGEDGDEALDI